MTKKKKTWIIIGAIFGSVIVILEVVIAISFPWSIMYLGSMLKEDPPPPDVSYGEFPFKLVYEIDGQITKIEETLVIEYVDSEYSLGQGDVYYWKKYYKSHGPFEDPEESYNAFYNKFLLFRGFNEGGSFSIHFKLGSCEYYMGLQEENHLGIRAGDIYILSSEYNGPISDEEVYSKYGIKIIEKYVSPPISEKTQSYSSLP